MKSRTLVILALVLVGGATNLLFMQKTPAVPPAASREARPTAIPTPAVPVVQANGETPVLQKRSLSASGKPSSATIATAKSDLKQVPGSEHGRPWQDIPDWVTLTPKARLLRLLSTPFGIQQSGQVQIMELAKDELWLPHPPDGASRSQKIDPQPDVEALLAEAESLQQRTGQTPQLVLYPVKRAHDDYSRRVVSEEILIHGQDASQLAGAVKAAGFPEAAPLDIAPGFVVAMDRRFPGSSLIGAADLSSSVAPAEAQLATLKQKRLVPTDPLFSKQWHLVNTGKILPSKAGIDVGITSTWDSYKGNGVTISIVDDGVEHTHPDLSAGYLAIASYDLVSNDSNPLPTAADDDHGTSVAGVAAARGSNGVGVSGAAPESMFGAVRLLGTNQSASTEARALGFGTSSLFNDDIHISSNSWGPPDGGNVMDRMPTVVREAMENGVDQGRSGRGVIYMFAAGNGREDLDQSNKDGYANSIYVNAIGAVTARGLLSPYSETGTNLIACAPSDGGSTDLGIVTTDRSGNAGYNSSTETTDLSDRAYTNSFGGTSSATPLASGVVALMLQANPGLGWRDVKEILLRSGRQLDPTSTGWVSRTGDSRSLPPIRHHQSYGGGMVNAAAAVGLAEGWINLGSRVSQTKTDQILGGIAIPDNNSTGITRNFDFSGGPSLRVEQVEVDLRIDHDFRGDLQVELISPSNVISTLTSRTPVDDGSSILHIFSSNRHWGEGSVGVWRLRVKDLAGSDVGLYRNATVTLHGEIAEPARLVSGPTGDLLLRAGSQNPPLELEATGTGYGDFAFAWTRGTTVLSSGVSATPTGSKYTLSTVTGSHAGSHTVTVSNAMGNETRSFRLGVVAELPASTIVNVGSTITLNAPATVPTGVTPTYEWKRGGVTMTDDVPGPLARIKGTASKTLTILKAVTDDAASYECFVTMGTASQSSGATALSVRIKPEIQLTAFPADWIVSGAVSLPSLDIQNGYTKVTITGLPSGMTYNRITGAISGTPTVPVTNKPITITVTNLAGTTTKVINLTVAPLPTMVLGTFNGLVGRHNLSSSNGTFGGAISSLVVSASGSFTGKLVIGAQPPWTFTGRLNASTAADPEATVQVRRGTILAALTLHFSIDRDTGHLTGTLTEAPGLVASVDAWRRTAGPTVGLRHNFILDPGTVDAALAPAGFSAGYLTHTPTTGAITAVVKLADGTTVTKVTSRGFEGDIPLFAMLYTNKGSLHGKLVVADALTPALDLVSGSFTWNKVAPASSKDQTYAAGFDFGVAAGSALTVDGSEYVKPVKAVLPNPPNILWGLDDVLVGQTNARLSFTKAGIESSAYYLANAADINKALRITATHTVAIPLPNPAAVKLSLNATIGQISGTLTLKDGTPTITRTLSYFGVTLPNSSKARGWFKLTQFPGPTIQSGVMEFIE